MPDCKRPFIVLVLALAATAGLNAQDPAPPAGTLEEIVAHGRSLEGNLNGDSPDRMSRGLAGHSMGGYGALRIGMKRPDVFSSLHPMSACCLMDRGDPGPAMEAAGGYTTREEVAALRYPDKSTLARAAAWSPNPTNPPFYFDLPVEDGVPQPEIQAKWLANSPLAMLDQYAANLRRLTAIQFGVGVDDNLVGVNRELDQALTQAGIEHVFETYDGDHNNRVWERIETAILPFFSRNLEFE